MGLGFLLRLFGPHADNGFFGYLKSRDLNRTRRAIEQDRNLTRIKIHEDLNRTLIELERERRVTTLGVIEQLKSGGEYRESTTVGKREIKTPVPPDTLVVLPYAEGDHEQKASERTQLLSQQPLPLDQPLDLDAQQK